MEDNLLHEPCKIDSIHEVGDDMVDELGVLAIDAQIFSLQYLCAVLHKCNYKVKTTTSEAEARSILSGNKHGIDIVLVDVDSSGFELLETIGLEMYLPVIMVTGDGSLENITKGLLSGAANYIIKPVGVQEIKSATQNLVTPNKIRNSRKSSDHQETSDDQNLKRKANIESEDASSGSRKKRRLVWTPELHSKFVKAVQSLEKNVIETEIVFLDFEGSMVHPKRILDVMKEPGLKRENIASHLQKYRNSVIKQKAETNQQGLESERVIRSSYARNHSHRKWEDGDVNGDRLAVPRFNRFQPMIPYGRSLVPDNSFQSLPNGCLLGDPNFQTPDFKSFNYYNYCLQMNIQPQSVGSDPSSCSSAPFYRSPNAFWLPEADAANFQSPFSVNSVPNLVSGGVPNYAGSTALKRNGEVNGTTMSPTTGSSSQHDLKRDHEVPEMDYNQVESEESFDFYSLFNDDVEENSGLTNTI
ncbi:hypothetical protein DITRI_Ditri10aG0181400 [Diplodiscus trichospermus]